MLCASPFLPPRSYLGNLRRLRMENGRAAPYQGYGKEHHRITSDKGKHDDTGKGEEHGHGQLPCVAMPVGIHTHKRLHEGGGELEHEGDEAYLNE